MKVKIFSGVPGEVEKKVNKWLLSNDIISNSNTVILQSSTEYQVHISIFYKEE